MKQTEKGSGRGFDSRRLHQMQCWDNYFPPLNLVNYNLCWQWKIAFDGGDQVSTGPRLGKWTARESTDVISEKL